MKLAAYLRVSTETQAVHGLGLDIQREAITGWAKANGHRIVGWYSDEGISGANGVETRQGLHDALAAIAQGQAVGLLAYNLDRLARALHVQEGILGQAWALGGTVFTVESGEVAEDDPDDPYRTAMRQMRGVFSQLEKGVIVARLRAGRRQKRLQGGYSEGAPPLGLKALDGALVPNDQEQATVARIVALRASGASLRGVCHVLAQEGLRPKRGDRWHPQTVADVLRRADMH